MRESGAPGSSGRLPTPRSVGATPLSPCVREALAYRRPHARGQAQLLAEREEARIWVASPPAAGLRVVDLWDLQVQFAPVSRRLSRSFPPNGATPSALGFVNLWQHLHAYGFAVVRWSTQVTRPAGYTGDGSRADSGKPPAALR